MEPPLRAHVYRRIDDLVEKNIASRNVAGRYLNTLESIGIVRREKIGRDFFHINSRLYDLFESYPDMH